MADHRLKQADSKKKKKKKKWVYGIASRSDGGAPQPDKNDK